MALPDKPPHNDQPNKDQEEFSIGPIIEEGAARLTSGIVQLGAAFITEPLGGLYNGMKEGTKIFDTLISKISNDKFKTDKSNLAKAVNFIFVGGPIALLYGAIGVVTSPFKAISGFISGLIEKPDLIQLKNKLKNNITSEDKKLGSNWAKTIGIGVGVFVAGTVVGLTMLSFKLASRVVAGAVGGTLGYLKKTIWDSVRDTINDAVKSVKKSNNIGGKFFKSFFWGVFGVPVALGRMGFRSVTTGLAQAWRSAKYGLKNGLEGGGLTTNFTELREKGLEGVENNLKGFANEISGNKSKLIPLAAKHSIFQPDSIATSPESQKLAGNLLKTGESAALAKAQLNSESAQIIHSATESKRRQETESFKINPEIISNSTLSQSEIDKIKNNSELSKWGNLNIEPNGIKITGKDPINFIVQAAKLNVNIPGPFTLNIDSSDKFAKTTATNMYNAAKAQGVTINKVIYGLDDAGKPKEFAIKINLDNSISLVRPKPKSKSPQSPQTLKL